MKKLIFLLSVPCFLKAQISYTTIGLPSSVNETSGLELFGDYLITHNDKGDKAKLYIINQKGKKVMEIQLNQLKNKDWEDLASDSKYFYIADIGNNYATRENLKIYILDHDFFHQGTISIRYDAQKTFSREPINGFDAEGLAVVMDELVLFSKNRRTLKSEIYSFPKVKGDYNLIPKAVIDTKALVTAADYDEENDLMVLTGYNLQGKQFFYTLKDFRKNGYKNMQLQQYHIPIKSAQIEAVKIIDDDEFWVSSESEDRNTPKLFRLKLTE